MKKLLALISLLGIALTISSSCSKYDQSKTKFDQSTAVVRVLNERKAALARSENGKRSVNFVEYYAALRTIDLSGCPQKFSLAWRDYVQVIGSKKGFGIFSGASDIRESETRLEGAAIDAGVTFDFSKNR